MARYPAAIDIRFGGMFERVSQRASPRHSRSVDNAQGSMFFNRKRRIRNEEAFSCVLDDSPRPVVHGGWLSFCVATGDDAMPPARSLDSACRGALRPDARRVHPPDRRVAIRHSIVSSAPSGWLLHGRLHRRPAGRRVDGLERVPPLLRVNAPTRYSLRRRRADTAFLLVVLACSRPQPSTPGQFRR